MSNPKASKMEKFLKQFTDRIETGAGCWTWIGRTAYLRGDHGTFKLEIWSGGIGGRVAGLVGIYAPHSGGDSDRIEFRFEDFLEGHNVKSNPNWTDGRPPYADDQSWDWYIAPPYTVDPIADAIEEWVYMWNIRGAELEEAIADANRPARRSGRRR